MPLPPLSLWIPIAAVAYVCFAAMQATPGAWGPYAALLGLPLALWWNWHRPRHEATTAAPDAGVLHAARLGLWSGTALLAAALAAPPARPGFLAAQNLGAGIALASTLFALARLPSRSTLAGPPPATRSRDAALASTFLHGASAALPGLGLLWPSNAILVDPLALAYATAVAALGSQLLLVAATTRLFVLRRHEPGVADRALGAAVAAGVILAISVPATALRFGTPDRLLPMATTAAAWCVHWAIATKQASTVARTLRGAVVVLFLASPMAFLGAIVARDLVTSPVVPIMIVTAGGVLVGLLARHIAHPLGPDQSRWLDALEEASLGALQPEPEGAIRAALEALQPLTGTTGARPELWLSFPPRRQWVDVAGYLHTAEAVAPEELIRVALNEPERTLQLATLEAVQVQHPAARPLLAWYQSHKSFAAVAIVDDDGPQGFLLLPRGGRVAPLGEEETVAARRLADRLSTHLALSAALTRARDREQALHREVDDLTKRTARLERALALRDRRHRFAPEAQRDRLLRCLFSPMAQFARDAVLASARRNELQFWEVADGLDASGWIALAHLAGAGADGPLIEVDASLPREQGLERWQGDEAPWHHARGGTLVIRWVQALPTAAQHALAEFLASRGAERGARSLRPAEPVQRPAPAVGASGEEESAGVPSPTPLAPEESLPLAPAQVILLQRPSVGGASPAPEPPWRRLVPALPFPLPRLEERPEDLRALILDELSRLGAERGMGGPLAIDQVALVRLLDHPWPGNDEELHMTLRRAAAEAGYARLGRGSFLPSSGPGAPSAGAAPPPRDSLDHDRDTAQERGSPPAARPAARRNPVRRRRDPL